MSSRADFCTYVFLSADEMSRRQPVSRRAHYGQKAGLRHAHPDVVGTARGSSPGLRPLLTSAALVAQRNTGRDGETATFSRTEKLGQEGSHLLGNLIA